MVLAKQFAAELVGMYPPPLKLNVEPFGDQDFLEAKVWTDSSGLHSRLLNMVVKDQLLGLPPYRRRQGDHTTMTRRTAQTLVDGIALRCLQYASDSLMLAVSLLELKYEVITSGVALGVFHKAVRFLQSIRADDPIWKEFWEK